jgi:hypothetical protein
MTYAFLRSLGATTAITAVLALGTTPAVAQDTAPTLELPQAVSAPPVAPADSAPRMSEPVAPSAGTPPAVAPTLVLPAVSPEVGNSAEPARQPAPARSMARSAPAERAAPKAAVREAASSAPVAAAAVAPAAVTAPQAPVAAVPMTSAPVASVVDEPVDAAPVTREDTGLGGDASLAALLAALGLAGGAGWLALRSRRRRAPEEQGYDELVLNNPAITPRARAESAMPRPEPRERELVTEHAVTARPTARAVGYQMLSSPIQPGVAPRSEEETAFEQPAFRQPDGPVPRGEARDALLERMIDAPASAENPFRSRKARRRRARIILQTLEQQQREAAVQPFDWRTYDQGRHVAPPTPQPVTV